MAVALEGPESPGHAAGPHGSVPAGPARRGTLRTTPFLATCAATFFCYAQNYVTLPLLPIMVLSIGGDAGLLGLLVAAFSATSFLLRPFVGQLVDAWSLKRVFAGGALVLGVTGFGYALPSLAALFVNRSVHGIGWAAINTAGSSAIAALAPPARRAEAGGYYSMMPGLAQATMPAVALAVVPLAGPPGAFAIAGTAGFLAALCVLWIRLPRVEARPPTRVSWRDLLDRTALLPMAVEALASSLTMLVLVFVPLYALTIGVAIPSLGIYFTVIGGTLVVGLASLGRLSDHLGRGPVIALGGASLIVAVCALWLARDLVGLSVAGLAYGLGMSLIQPTTFGLAADRADPLRRGKAFATYSMSFQLANGVGGLLWGSLIALWGFPAAFACALAIQSTVLVTGLLLSRQPTRA